MGSEKIVQEIRIAFDDSLIPNNVFSEKYSDIDDIRSVLKNGFHKKRWTEVSFDVWLNSAGIVAVTEYMTPEGFYYYLPSLLSGVLLVDGYLDFGLEAILPRNSSREQKGDWWFKYKSLFTEMQKLVLCDFVKFAKQKSSLWSVDYALADYASDIWCINS